MNKRKIMMMALALCMVAIIAVGGTLAYFTDTDKEDNVFTIGKVNIELIEQQRELANGEDGKPDNNQKSEENLEAFEDNKKLYPVVGSAQGEKDAMGMPTAKNYVDKIITVEVQEDSEDTYVRVYIAIPSVLDNVADAGQNILHFNWGNNFETGDYTAADHANWGTETLVVKEFNIGGILYNIYYRTYNKVLAAGEETGSAAYVGFYLDAGVDYDHTNGYYTINGEEIKYDFSKDVTIPVYAIGVQSTGFDNADAALDAAFGAGYNPWTVTTNN